MFAWRSPHLLLLLLSSWLSCIQLLLKSPSMMSMMIKSNWRCILNITELAKPTTGWLLGSFFPSNKAKPGPRCFWHAPHRQYQHPGVEWYGVLGGWSWQAKVPVKCHLFISIPLWKCTLFLLGAGALIIIFSDTGILWHPSHLRFLLVNMQFFTDQLAISSCTSCEIRGFSPALGYLSDAISNEEDLAGGDWS
jgi:hypothetical protein